MAEALHPGELNRILTENYPLIKWAVSRYCQSWVRRIGFDDCMSEAHTGAMNGVVTWILKGGPERAVKDLPQTYIVRGIRYHFSAAGFTWWAGPIRMTNKALAAGYRPRLKSLPGVGEDWIPESERDAFVDPVGPDDSAEYAELTDAASEAVNRADLADPSGAYYVALSLFFGLSGVRPATCGQIGTLLCCSKQGVQQMISRAINLVRGSYRSGPPNV